MHMSNIFTQLESLDCAYLKLKFTNRGALHNSVKDDECSTKNHLNLGKNVDCV